LTIDTLAWNPVDWGGDSVLVASLKGVDDAEDFCGVAAGRSWVGENCTDSLLGVNDEDGADGERNALGVDIGGVLVVNPVIPSASVVMIRFPFSSIWYVPNRVSSDVHVVGIGDLALLVSNDGELQAATGDLINVLDPSTVALDGVGGKANELNTTLGELGLEFCKGTKLGGADRGVVLWVRKEDDPVVANKLVKVDGASGGFGVEVGGDGAQTERLRTLFVGHVVLRCD